MSSGYLQAKTQNNRIVKPQKASIEEQQKILIEEDKSKNNREVIVIEELVHKPKDRKSDRIEKRRSFKTEEKDLYQDFKDSLEEFGISYSFDLTYIPQRGSPNGKKPLNRLWRLLVLIGFFLKQRSW